MTRPILNSVVMIILSYSAHPCLAKSDLKNLDKATEFTRSQKTTRLEISKTVSSELLEKETQSDVIVHTRKGRLRWETESPEKTLLVFDGKNLWIASYPPEDFDDPVQVTKTSLSKKRDDQVLLGILTGKLIPSKSFELISSENKKNVTTFKLKMKGHDDSVKNLEVKVDGIALTEISYKDDVENLTKLEIRKSETIKKVEKDLFDFKVPKGAEVSDL